MKTPVGNGEYDIRSIAINEKEIVDLLSNSLEGYEVYYVPVFTHNISYQADADLVILIKRYSSSLRTLSVMGKKASVERMLQRAQEIINLRILPDPTNIRTVNRDLSLDFEYATVSNEESNFFEKYKEKQ